MSVANVPPRVHQSQDCTKTIEFGQRRTSYLYSILIQKGIVILYPIHGTLNNS